MAKVIAELCQNHNGDRGLIREMVAEASRSGAHYAKLQTLHSSQLTHRPRFDTGLIEGGVTKVIKRPYDAEYSRLSKLDISESDVEFFLECCKDSNILPMTTVFTRDVVDKTFKQGFTSIKLASFDCISLPLAEDILSYSPELLIVSTGCTYDYEIQSMARLLSTAKQSCLMHCVSIYPTPPQHANLDRLKFLSSLNSTIGLSDHSNYEKDGLNILKVAVSYGIKFVERHFTILPADQTKDGVVSLNPSQLKEAVEICSWSSEEQNTFISANSDLAKTVAGSQFRQLSPVELLNRDYYQGRVASKSTDGSVVYNWDNSYSRDQVHTAS